MEQGGWQRLEGGVGCLLSSRAAESQPVGQKIRRKTGSVHGDSINTHSQRTERKAVERKDVRSGKAADGVWMMDDGGLTGVLHIKSIGFCFGFFLTTRSHSLQVVVCRSSDTL